MCQGKKYSVIAVIALAFLLNAVLPYYAFAAKPSAASTTNERFTVGKVLICTATGYKWVSLDSFNNTARSNTVDDAHNFYECALCYLNQDSADKVLPGSFVYPLVPRVAYIGYNTPFLKIKVVRLLYGGITRAPPHSLS